MCDGFDGEARIEAIEAHNKQADAKVRAAIAEYRAAHPECSEQGINTIAVIDEEAKQLIEKVKERTRDWQVSSQEF